MRSLLMWSTQSDRKEKAWSFISVIQLKRMKRNEGEFVIMRFALLLTFCKISIKNINFFIALVACRGIHLDDAHIKRLPFNFNKYDSLWNCIKSSGALPACSFRNTLTSYLCRCKRCNECSHWTDNYTALWITQ